MRMQHSIGEETSNYLVHASIKHKRIDICLERVSFPQYFILQLLSIRNMPSFSILILLPVLDCCINEPPDREAVLIMIIPYQLM